VSLRKARFVRDVASYLQNSPRPAADVLSHQQSDTVASIVVVPLMVGDDDRVFGALYFTQQAACDFSNIQEALLVRGGGGRGPGAGAPRRRSWQGCGDSA
jgi:hypothetical protein